MKKQIIAMILVLLVFVFVACSATEQTLDYNKEKVELSFADTESFSSLQAFIQALEQNTNRSNASEDVAELSDLDTYYIPTGIPEGYGLGRIIAGVSDIAFYYYPMDALGSKDNMMLAEGRLQCFEFRFYRWDLEQPLQGIMQQINQTEENYIDEKYLWDSFSSTYYWEENGDALSMTLPTDFIRIDISPASICAIDIIKEQK